MSPAHSRNLSLITLDDGYEVGPAKVNFDKLLNEHDVLLLAGVYGSSAKAFHWVFFLPFWQWRLGGKHLSCLLPLATIC